MANSDLHVIRFLGLNLEDNLPDERCVRKDGEPVFGYKQHTLVNHTDLVMVVETTAANCHDSKPLLGQKHHEALRSHGIKNDIQDRILKSRPLAAQQLQHNHSNSDVVERAFGSQTRWFAYISINRLYCFHFLIYTRNNYHSFQYLIYFRGLLDNFASS